MINFDTSYLNKSVNKYPRKGKTDKAKTYSLPLPEYIILHETANKSGDAHQTLKYNLDGTPQSSYHVLIARDGTIYQYIDEKLFIAYGAGVNSQLYQLKGWDVNVHTVNVELDGPNDGTSVTNKQLESLKLLLDYYYDMYGIIINDDFIFFHKDVAPFDQNHHIYKTDPRGITKQQVMMMGLRFEGKATISREKFKDIMHDIQSPILDESYVIYDLFISRGIDPAVGLAFAFHENKLGTLGITKDYDLKNWGNVRTPYLGDIEMEIISTGKGSFVKYHSWTDSVRDWIARIYGRYIKSGMPTVETAIPVYSPTSDGNNVNKSIRAIRNMVKQWQGDGVSSIPVNDKGDVVSIATPVYLFWLNSGGVWKPDQFTLGYLVDVQDKPDHTLYIFERGYVKHSSITGVQGMLLSEIKQDE